MSCTTLDAGDASTQQSQEGAFARADREERVPIYKLKLAGFIPLRFALKSSRGNEMQLLHSPTARNRKTAGRKPGGGSTADSAEDALPGRGGRVNLSTYEFDLASESR
jgi:hypothetical protein